MGDPIATEVLVADLREHVKYWFKKLIDDTGLEDWPSSAPRFDVQSVEINFDAPSIQWHVAAMVQIVGPEQLTNGEYHRRNGIMVEHVALLVDLDDSELIRPYFEAFARVLAILVSRALTLYDDNATAGGGP